MRAPHPRRRNTVVSPERPSQPAHSLYPVPALRVETGMPVLSEMGVRTEYNDAVAMPVANVSSKVSLG